MTRVPVAGEKRIEWMGSSYEDLIALPADVQDRIGFVLNVAQFGGKHFTAKPWKGEGPGVLEVAEDFQGNTYRVVYTVRFEAAVYVLHVFQKKSPRGRQTARPHIALVRSRLKQAALDYKERYGQNA